MKKYGFPYIGSKNKLAEKIINVLPQSDHFYDLFAGGCAITHCALESDKWKHIHANDMQGTVRLFTDAILGKYKNERAWISREDFFTRKDMEPYVRWIWSFGNNGEDYMFGKNVEETKRKAHEYLMENGYDGTKEKRLAILAEYKKQFVGEWRFELERLQQLEQLQQLQQLQQLEQLERLQQLERLERLERLETSTLDYRSVEIKPNSVVYCDPPYATNSSKEYYGVIFDTSAFWEWVMTRDFPVFVSEYKAPEGVQCIAEFEHRSTISATMNNKVLEKLFWNGKGELLVSDTLF